MQRAIMFLITVVLTASPALAVQQEGIDVSKWQKSIDWKAVKQAGIKFAFTKATEGNAFVDPHFAENMKGAAAVGILIGPYHFARPDNDRDNLQDAAKEADHFVDTIQAYYGGTSLVMRPVIDIEKLPGFGKKAEDKAFLSQWTHQFAEVVNKRLGFYPLIYANSNYAKNYFDNDIARYELWLANWTLDANKQPGKSENGIWKQRPFWQYTSHGQVHGIGGRVDRDVFNGTMFELAQFVPGFYPGDFDRNGRVDDRDKGLWNKTKGQAVNPGIGADSDLSGTVDAADLEIWKANRGKTYVKPQRRAVARRNS